MKKTTIAHGFTLLEAMVVVAIVGILTALGISGLGTLRSRASFASVASDVVTGLRRTRAEAFGRGASTSFVIDTAGKRWWGIQAGDIDLDVFDPDAPGTIIASGTLPKTVDFGPATAQTTALPAPLDKVPLVAGDAPNFSYCSFCRKGGKNPGMGVIAFDASGTARFTPKNADWDPTGDLRIRVGQFFSLQAVDPKIVDRTRIVAVLGRTGIIKTFER